MKELNFDNYDLVKPMLEKIPAGFTYFKAVLDGNSPGKVLVDDELSPTVSLIWAPFQYSCLIGELGDNSFVKTALEWLDAQASERHGYHCLVLHPSNEGNLPGDILSGF
ncbi:MAG: hypothetical protein ACR2P1_05640, partial [Pseudomonadales bacterium]